MPWCFEDRTSLAVPQHGLSWRHLKASTQSTNKNDVTAQLFHLNRLLTSRSWVPLTGDKMPCLSTGKDCAAALKRGGMWRKDTPESMVWEHKGSHFASCLAAPPLQWRL